MKKCSEIKKHIINQLIDTGIKSAIDLGCGDGELCDYLSDKGIDTTGIDVSHKGKVIKNSRYKTITGNISCTKYFGITADCVVASHCLEHLVSPIESLKSWRKLINDNGYLCVIVPPFTHQVVGRHTFVGWNIGRLMLLLFRCGFNIRNGKFLQRGYNVAAIVQKQRHIKYINTNDEILIKYHHEFPEVIAKEIMTDVVTNDWGEKIGFFNGNISSLNWG